MFSGHVDAIGTITALRPLPAVQGASNTTTTTKEGQSPSEEGMETPRLSSDMMQLLRADETQHESDTDSRPPMLLTVHAPALFSQPGPDQHAFKVDGSECVAMDGMALVVHGCDAQARTIDLVFHQHHFPHLVNHVAPYQTGTSVNLERAILPTSRLSGPFVQGKPDASAMILSVTYDARAQIILLTCQLSVSADDKNAFFSCLSPGGHVVLDGASLKVAAVDLSNQSAAAAAASAMPFKGRASSISTVSTASSAAANATAQFTVSVLPTAMDQLTLARKRVGSQVNVEIDLLGKHILRSVEVTLRDQLQQASEGEEDEMHKTGLEKIIEREVVKVLEKKGLLGKAAHLLGR